MIDKLPHGDASAFTSFLRKVQASGCGESERRYLWERARRDGLDFDRVADEFVPWACNFSRPAKG